MADQTPGNSPFDDRLRATFSAEYADMERRLLAQGDTPTPARNVKWIPFAVAAATIALAGFFFIGNRSDDQAVDLDVAAQPPTAQPSPERGTPVAVDVNGQPVPISTPGIVLETLFFPYQTGVKYCNNYDPDRTFVWGPDGGAPVLAEPEVSGVIGVTRRVSRGDIVRLVGGCTAGATSIGTMEWYEIASPSGEKTEWIRSDYLLTGDEFGRRSFPDAIGPVPTPPLNGCGEVPLVFPFRFIWGIAVDDPDGGLVAHTEVGIDAPRTRIIERDEVVAITGGCELSESGSKWRQLHVLDGSQDWVSGRFLREPVGACLDASTATPLPGLAIVDGDSVAFAPVNAQRYDLYPADRVTLGTNCGITPDIMPCPVFGTLFVWEITDDDPDGGLLTHTLADVESPVVRTLPSDMAGLTATGLCRQSSSGSLWWQLDGPDGADWASGNFLAHPQPACLVSDAVLVPDEEPFFHTTTPGDTLGSIAELYNITIEMMLAGDPALNPNLLIAGQLIRIPGASTITEQLATPVDGWVVRQGDRSAFAPKGADTWRWYPSAAVVESTNCIPENEVRRPLCLSNQIHLFALDQPEPIWTGDGPQTVWTTETPSVPSPAHQGRELLEVDLLDDGGSRLTGFLDPAETSLNNGHCVFAGSDALADQPCTRVAGADRTVGLGLDEASRSWVTGTPGSAADHVHDLRTETNSTCTRLVIEFGQNANEADLPAALLPPLVVDHGLVTIAVSPTSRPWESSFDDPQRIDYGDGIGLFTLSSGYKFSLQFMHHEMEPHVRFMRDPARIVIDLFPHNDARDANAFGEKFVLRQPIQQDLTGPGVPVNNGIVVAGFGRPFEAAGLYRIWLVPNDTDPEIFLANPPEPIIEEFFATSGWAEGWGEFFVDLPDLRPGTYIAVFGELPPTDEIGFYGTGQLFRIAPPVVPVDAIYPEAVLLPDVQLPPEG